MKYLYLILLVLIVYYVFKNIYSNYSNSEHFDPSLVPVSSIITLAKVAQKLVDGNGTLTNPGNLQIGVPSAPGNLKVTGTTELNGESTTITGVTRINGGTSIYGTLSTTGYTAIGGNTTIAGNTTTSGYITASGTNAPRVDFIGSGGGQHMYSYIQTPTLHMGPGWNEGDIIESKAKAGLLFTSDSNNGVTVLGKFGVTGNVNIGGELTVGHTKGGRVVTDNIKALTYFDSDNKPRLQFYGKDGHNYYTLGKVDPDPAKPDDPRAFGTKHVFRGPEGLDSACTVEMMGNASVAGNLDIGPITMAELLQLKLMLRAMRYDIPFIRHVALCTPATPIVLVDGFVNNATGNASAWPFQIGDYPRLDTNYPYTDQGSGGSATSKAPAGDRMDLVFIYPGYGFIGWSGYNFENDNKSQTPLTLNNTSKEILYYHLFNGRSSTLDNVNNFGVNLHDVTNPSSGSVNLQNHLSSFKAYKL
jgi:hypothetical protein